MAINGSVTLELHRIEFTHKSADVDSGEKDTVEFTVVDLANGAVNTAVADADDFFKSLAMAIQYDPDTISDDAGSRWWFAVGRVAALTPSIRWVP